jgi:hypothetical protein
MQRNRGLSPGRFSLRVFEWTELLLAGEKNLLFFNFRGHLAGPLINRCLN